MAPFLRALLALLCLTSSALRAEGPELEPGELGKSAIPIAGYDDKSGWLFGAAGFLYTDKEPGINAGLFAISNGDNFHSATFNLEKRGAGRWSFALHLLGERAFDNYYGEGDLTSPHDPLFMRVTHFEAKPTVLYLLRRHLRVGAFTDYRSRQEEAASARLFPDETNMAAGLTLQWDTRDKLINTRQGDLLQMYFAHRPGGGAFSLAGADLRRFWRLRRNLVLGTRVVAGITEGQPSYLFRHRLGGLDLLRGYKDNRFRGWAYLVDQEELRWLITKWLSVNVSFDLGGISDDAVHQLKLTGQAGLRLGLPPDWGQKMRVDFGAGADQITFQIQFGEIF